MRSRRLSVSAHGARTLAEKREPEGPPARWEPKLPTTFSPSGSGAPSNLRSLRAAAGPPTVVRLAAPLRLRGLRIASRRPVSRGPPAWFALRRSLRGRRVRSRDLLRRSGPPSDPCGSSWVPRVRSTSRCPGRSSGPLASITSTAWSEANHTGGPEGGQLRVSAGQSMNMQVDTVGQRVTNRCPFSDRDVVAGQRPRRRWRSARASSTSPPGRPRRRPSTNARATVRRRRSRTSRTRGSRVRCRSWTTARPDARS